VKFSPTLKLLLAVLLALTLLWKLAVKADDDVHPEDDVIAFLTRQGFDAVTTEDISLSAPNRHTRPGMNDGVMNFRGIRAVRGACHMRIMMPSYYGADRDIARSLVTADDRLIFVHRGSVYQEQPVLLTASAELWSRALRKIGLNDRHLPVLAVVAQRQCEAERIPWGELR
jgi:hypothetical protein